MATNPELLIVGEASAKLAAAQAFVRKGGARDLAPVDEYLAEVFRLGIKIGYDPAVVAAQAMLETGNFTTRYWTERFNPAGIGVLQAQGGPTVDLGYRWASGRDAARAHITHLSAYVAGYDPRLQPHIKLDPRWQAVFEGGYAGKVRAIPELAGKWASDPEYGPKIKRVHDAIRAAIATPTPTPQPTPGGAPLPGGIVQHPTGNWHERTGGQQPLAVTYHVTDDMSLANVLSWFQSPGSNASAHVVIDRDGTIHQCVSSTKAAWTNGDYARSRTDIPWLNDAIRECVARRRNLNDYTITIEHVGKPGVAFTEAQYASSIALSRYWLDRYGIPAARGRQLRHADINGVTRTYCPSSSFDLARVIKACGGDSADMRV